ncbi:carbohydrate kinase [Nocardioides sp. zg-DK7169]|nr:carbohydrate kinase [Nocardioides sp. zg-DK7169]
MLVVGESLVDVVEHADGSRREHPGGSAANVAVALARLDRPVRLATALADDRYGAIVATYLGRDRVSLAVDPETIERTASARAVLDAEGAARYELDLEWVLTPVPAEPAPLAVHACSLAAVLAPGAEEVLATLRRLRGTALVTYDVNARPVLTGSGEELAAAVERVVALADLVKASDEDLLAVYPELSEDEAVARLLSLGPVAVVLTRGAAGATWHGSGRSVSVAAPTVEVVDTIGAGDTFSAALLDALWARGLVGPGAAERIAALPRRHRTKVLTHAVRAGALATTRPGADPPYRAEVGSPT